MEAITLSEAALQKINNLTIEWLAGELSTDEVGAEIHRIVEAEAWRLACEEDEHELLYGTGAPLPLGLINAVKGMAKPT